MCEEISALNELMNKVNKLEDRIQKLSNIFLNIKFNSDLFLKIMRLEQREIKRDQEIAVLKGKIDGLGENLWGMKTKEEWARIDKTIQEITSKEFVDFIRIQYEELISDREICKKEDCCKIEEMLAYILNHPSW